MEVGDLEECGEFGEVGQLGKLGKPFLTNQTFKKKFQPFSIAFIRFQPISPCFQLVCIGAIIHNRREIQGLPYAGFKYFVKEYFDVIFLQHFIVL